MTSVRSHLTQLLISLFLVALILGVIFLFVFKGGNFMHCKTFVSDDYLSSIGTANVDIRSFKLNYEDNVYLYDRELALRNREIFFEDLEDCIEVTLAEVLDWRWYQRLPQRLMRLLAPLL